MKFIKLVKKLLSRIGRLGREQIELERYRAFELRHQRRTHERL
jgi:hypothetical protein